MTIDEIKQDTRWLCGATSGTYANTDLVRNINIAYSDTARLIWTSAGGWQYDDSNATTLPIGKTTMVHSQQDYELPSTCQRVQRVEVKDDAGNWTKLSELDIHDSTIAMPELYETDGLPIYYDVLGRSIMLYPKPSSAYCTLASGLAVYFDRDVTPFNATASSTVPGFATPFHRILSYAAAIDFEQDPAQRNILIGLKQKLEDSLLNFYAKREVERETSIRPKGRKKWFKYT